MLLVHEPGADYTEGKGRKAWQYLTGQRRVRLAPAVSFDTPNPGVAGTSTYDDSYIYNGSLERFNWKLVGKQEMYIPYNTYAFVFQTLSAICWVPNSSTRSISAGRSTGCGWWRPT
ncbi:MAG: DUF1329 domain-containing protein [Pseudomonadales bacterium]|nr:DUF1329 domain-containing protein [Pseudomonadales bacterium]